MNAPAALPHRIVVTDQSPHSRETRYDRTVAALWALALFLGGLCIMLIVIWQQFLQQTASTPPIPGNLTPGENTIRPDGSPIVIPSIERPDQSFDEASELTPPLHSNLAEQVATVTAVDSVESAAAMAASGQQADPGNLGQPGKPLHAARSDRLPEQQWDIEVTSPGSVNAYTRMLEHFGIEPFAVYPDGRLAYLELSNGRHQIRRSTKSEHETRFYATWNSGTLQQLDDQLFSDAGIQTTNATMVHFFSAATEQMLEQKALAFAGRSAAGISRTWFRLRQSDNGFDIEVIRQTGR